MQTKQLFIAFLFLLSFSICAQSKKFPALWPYELGGKGKVAIHDSLLKGNLKSKSAKMELTDLPKDHPYRIVAYFDSTQLISLHVIFGETGDGLSSDAYKSITEILKKLWPDYPSGTIKGRRKLNNIAEVWETMDFRIEWTYMDQPGNTGKKMGWLFMYTRNKYVDHY